MKIFLISLIVNFQEPPLLQVLKVQVVSGTKTHFPETVDITEIPLTQDQVGLCGLDKSKLLS